MIPLLAAFPSWGADVRQIEEFDLEELLSMDTQVASLSPMSIRETPGIVTILTREDILSSGARDLADVLRQVPGFHVELDTQGVASVGFRGIWGQEGKILLLVDGQEMNDLLYGTLQLRGHFPLDNLASIEIVRGPGSVIYGGHAELAVIRLTTREGEYARVSGTYGQLEHPDLLQAYGRRMVTASVGHELGEHAQVNASLHVGQAQGSIDEYVDAYGGRAELLGQNVARPLQVNLGARVHGLSLRLLHDDYDTTTRDGFNQALPEAHRKDFATTSAELRYAWSLTDSYALTPWLSFRCSTPWQDRDPSSPTFYDVTATRLGGGLQLTAELWPTLHLHAGAEAQRDDAEPNQPAAEVFERNGLEPRSNAAAFLELAAQHELANVDAGVRLQAHSLFGPVVAPRLALTRLLGPWHLKLLGSYAFRDPDLETSAYNPQLDRERTRILEAEVGLRVAEGLYASGNVFEMRIDDPVVYVVDEFNPSGSYFNATQTGSRGLEAEVRSEASWGSLDGSYSFYRSTTEVPEYQVSGHPGLALAFPAHKVTLAGTLELGRGLQLDPSVVWTSQRYGYDERTPTGTGTVRPFAPQTLVNVFVGWQDLLLPGLDVDAGVFDVLDTRYTFLQAYDSFHAPLPGTGREYLLRISFEGRLFPQEN
jgi:outer membrane cobalamin receptor